MLLQQEPVRSQSEDLKKSIGISVALHSLVVSLFLIRSLFFSEPHIDLSQAITVSVGQLPDTNRLPEKVQPIATAPEPAPEPTPPAPAPEPEPAPPEPVAKEKTPPPPETKALPPKEQPPKNTEVNLDKSKAKQQEALNRLKKMSAVEQIRQQVKNETASRNKASAAPARSHVIAAGTTLSGLDRLQANDYLGLVDQSIKQHWTLPQWLMNKPLKAQLLVKFSAQGQILSKEIITSSGNSTYDQYCLDAIDKASPFPSVPEKLSEKFRVDGIVIGFPE